MKIFLFHTLFEDPYVNLIIKVIKNCSTDIQIVDNYENCDVCIIGLFPEDLEKIASVLNINLKDLILHKKFIPVKINKYKESLKWNYPSEKNYVYKFTELTNVNQLPCSKALELSVILEEDHEIFIEVPAHQYLYNIGETDCILEIGNIKQKFSPGDSVYLKPNVKHKFLRKSKKRFSLLIYVKAIHLNQKSKCINV